MEFYKIYFMFLWSPCTVCLHGNLTTEKNTMVLPVLHNVTEGTSHLEFNQDNSVTDKDASTVTLHITTWSDVTLHDTNGTSTSEVQTKFNLPNESSESVQTMGSNMKNESSEDVTTTTFEEANKSFESILTTKHTEINGSSVSELTTKSNEINESDIKKDTTISIPFPDTDGDHHQPLFYQDPQQSFYYEEDYKPFYEQDDYQPIYHQVEMFDQQVETTTITPESRFCKPLHCHHHFCSCNKLCILFGNCCRFVYEHVFNTSLDVDIFYLIKNARNVLRQNFYNEPEMKILEKVKNYGICKELNYEFSGMVISKCPLDYNNAFVKDKCTNTTETSVWNSPVYFPLPNIMLVVFRNLFCAYCHGYTIQQVEFYNTSLHCPSDETTTNDNQTPNLIDVDTTTRTSYTTDFNTIATNLSADHKYKKITIDKCYMTIDPPDVMLEPYECSTSIKDEFILCPGRATMAEVLCSSYVEPVYTDMDSSPLQNIHCLQCFPQATDLMDCHYRRKTPMEQPVYPGLDIFFSVEENGLVLSNNEIVRIDCADGKIFDFILMECKQIECPIAYSFGGFGCIPDDSQKHLSFKHEYQVNHVFRITIQKNYFKTVTSEIEYTFVVSEVSRVVKSVIGQFQQYTRQFHEKMSDVFEFNITDSSVLYEILLQIKNVTADENFDITMTIENFVNNSEMKCRSNTLLFVFTSVKYDAASKRVVAEFSENTSFDIYYTWFSLNLSDVHDVVHLSYCSQNIPDLGCLGFLTYTSNQFNISGNSLIINGKPVVATKTYFVRHDILYLCVDNETANLVCSSYEIYKQSEFNFVNDTLYIHKKRQVLFSKYFIRNNDLYLCVETIDSNTKVIRILTNVCIAFSLISLLFLILAHAVIPELQNLHGKNIVCLSISLFSGQGLFLLCRLVMFSGLTLQILSVCEHFFWLCVFSWTAVISFDVAKQVIDIYGSYTMSAVAATRRFYTYLFFSFGVPFIGVALCAVMDFQFSHKPLGYGLNGHCWISESNGLLYAYVIPVGVAVAFCLTCFLLILIKIEVTKRSTSIVTTKQKQTVTCVIYFKLFVLLGLSWILGFVSSNVDSLILSYVNSIINGLQGSFLTIICLLNGRLIRVMRNRRHPSSFSTKQSCEQK